MDVCAKITREPSKVQTLERNHLSMDELPTAAKIDELDVRILREMNEDARR